MAPASGDQDILEALFVHRILTSGQVALKTGRSAPVIRRRIRNELTPSGLVVAHRGGGSTEANAYSLTREGFDLVAGLAGVDPAKAPFSRRPPSGPGSPFFRHTRLVNTTWIEFSRSCSRPESPVELVRALPEWAMSSDPRKRRSRKPWERFLVSERLQDIRDPDRWHVVRPDALFLFAPREEPSLRVAASLEADRATVSVSTVIMEKILGYWHIFLRRSFERWGAIAMRVLFVIDSVRTSQRLESLAAAVGDFRRRNRTRHEEFRQARLEAAAPSVRATLARRIPTIDAFAGCFRMCLRSDFAEADILTDPIWLDVSGERVPFFRGTDQSSHEAPAATGEETQP